MPVSSYFLLGYLDNKLNLLPIFSLFVNSDDLIKIMNYNVWGYINKSLKITPHKRFNLIVYGLIIIGFIMNVFLTPVSFSFFSWILIFSLVLLLNEKKFHNIKKVYLWEVLIGIIIILSSFIFVTPVKWYFYPNTRTFGVLNGTVVIVGYFICAYGIRKYNIAFPYILFYVSLVVSYILLNPTNNSLLYKIGAVYIAPVTAYLAYNTLKFFGYPVSIYGTIITIISKNGVPLSATIAAACSGIESMFITTILLLGLFMGSQLKYQWRIILISGGVMFMYIINIFRIFIIFVAGYYYGQNGIQTVHTFAGSLFFITFILTYWHIINRKFNLKYD